MVALTGAAGGGALPLVSFMFMSAILGVSVRKMGRWIDRARYGFLQGVPPNTVPAKLESDSFKGVGRDR